MINAVESHAIQARRLGPDDLVSKLHEKVESLNIIAEESRVAASEWNKLLDWRDKTVGPWLVDEACDEHGNQLKYTVDAAIRDEPWLPNNFKINRFGRTWLIEIVQGTVYSVTEVQSC